MSIKYHPYRFSPCEIQDFYLKPFKDTDDLFSPMGLCESEVWANTLPVHILSNDIMQIKRSLFFILLLF